MVHGIKCHFDDRSQGGSVALGKQLCMRRGDSALVQPGGLPKQLLKETGVFLQHLIRWDICTYLQE